jgi:hypothetical protein
MDDKVLLNFFLLPLTWVLRLPSFRQREVRKVSAVC